MGIPEAFQDKLFERFSRASTSGGARTRGAGLGLRHGGTIQVESVPDQGSCFRLALPRIDVGGL